MLPKALVTRPPLFGANRNMLLDLLAATKVKILTNTMLKEVTDDGISVVDGDQKRKEIKTPTVALAMGLKSNDDLYESLIGKFPHLYKLGDCRKPLTIMQAIWCLVPGYFPYLIPG